MHVVNQSGLWEDEQVRVFRGMFVTCGRQLGKDRGWRGQKEQGQMYAFTSWRAHQSSTDGRVTVPGNLRSPCSPQNRRKILFTLPCRVERIYILS